MNERLASAWRSFLVDREFANKKQTHRPDFTLRETCVLSTGLDGRFALGGKSYRCHQFLNWWLPNATGIWHLNGFESWPHQKQKAPPLGGTFCFWCGRQDSNLHAFAEEPKSTESTNSTTPACSFVPLIFFTEEASEGSPWGGSALYQKQENLLLPGPLWAKIILSWPPPPCQSNGRGFSTQKLVKWGEFALDIRCVSG